MSALSEWVEHAATAIELLVVEIEERWPWQPRRGERGPVT